jgi:hypothetical protein
MVMIVAPNLQNNADKIPGNSGKKWVKLWPFGFCSVHITTLCHRVTERKDWGRIHRKKHGVWDPMPELTITSPYVHSRADSNTFTMGIGIGQPYARVNLNLMPESTFIPPSGFSLWILHEAKQLNAQNMSTSYSTRGWNSIPYGISKEENKCIHYTKELLSTKGITDQIRTFCTCSDGF